MALKGLMALGAQGTTGMSARGRATDEAAGKETEAAPRAVLAQPPGPRTVAPSTSVDASSELEGKLRCKDTLRIDGRIIGEIECDRSVIVGEGARVQAGINAEEVQVRGIVEGDITARRKVTLERTAVVVGNLTTPGIVIEEGAKLKGRILIGSDTEAEDEIATSKVESDTRASNEAKAGEAARSEASLAAKEGAKDDAKDKKKSRPSSQARAEAPKSEATSGAAAQA